MRRRASKRWPWLDQAHKWQGSEWPKLSVITPSFNQARFLEETIRSVLSQGYPNLEYIVIDGGSSDGSLEIIRRYDHQLAYWVSRPDRGQSDALNKGLERATGDIIGWINSDDMYTRGCFQAIVRAFHRNPEAVLIHGDRILLDENSQVMGWSCPPAFNPEVGWGICSETAFWRRTAVAGERFKTELQFAMDLEFFCRLHAKGRFVKLNEFLGYFRCYGSNKSSTMQDVCYSETKQEWELIYGTGHKGWQQKLPTDRLTHALKLVTNPLQLTFPYLYRRLILRQRGIQH